MSIAAFCTQRKTYAFIFRGTCSNRKRRLNASWTVSSASPRSLVTARAQVNSCFPNSSYTFSNSRLRDFMPLPTAAVSAHVTSRMFRVELCSCLIRRTSPHILCKNRTSSPYLPYPHNASAFGRPDPSSPQLTRQCRSPIMLTAKRMDHKTSHYVTARVVATMLQHKES